LNFSDNVFSFSKTSVLKALGKHLQQFVAVMEFEFLKCWFTFTNVLNVDLNVLKQKTWKIKIKFFNKNGNFPINIKMENWKTCSPNVVGKCRKSVDFPHLSYPMTIILFMGIQVWNRTKPIENQRTLFYENIENNRKSRLKAY
jgi:hypothetical protein